MASRERSFSPCSLSWECCRGEICDRLLVGASAGIYGIFIGVAVIAPDLRVTRFSPHRTLDAQLAIVMLVISIGSILLKLGGNEGGEAGHLGGAILGFILMRHPRLLSRDPCWKSADRESFFVSKLRPRTSVELERDPPWTSSSTRFPARVSRASPMTSGRSSRKASEKNQSRHMTDAEMTDCPDAWQNSSTACAPSCTACGRPAAARGTPNKPMHLIPNLIEEAYDVDTIQRGDQSTCRRNSATCCCKSFSTASSRRKPATSTSTTSPMA